MSTGLACGAASVCLLTSTLDIIILLSFGGVLNRLRFNVWGRLAVASGRLGRHSRRNASNRFNVDIPSSSKRRPVSVCRPKCSEGGAEFFGEELRLFPRREVAALVRLVAVDQVAIGAPGPGLGGAVDLLGKDRDGHGDRNLAGLLRGRAGEV